MNINETVNISLKALRQNKGRTFLTTLGVIIGVFAVVSLVSLLRGVENYITDQFEALGSNLLFVYPGGADLTDDPALSFTNNKLSLDNIDSIEKGAGEYIDGITPMYAAGKTAEYKTKAFFSTVIGTNTDYEKLINVAIVKGRFFTDNEVRSNEKVAVIGPLVKKELFGGRNAIGAKIDIDGDSYKVIGITEEKGADFDEIVAIPYTTMNQKMDVEEMAYIMLEAKNEQELDFVTQKVEIAMLRDLKADEFTVYTQKDLLDTIQNILGIITAALGAVAAISLLVGGIGIMNIMLVSVTERIREIGLRKAVGATPFNIGSQFLVESVIISIAGGLIGLALGWGSTLVAQKWLRAEVPIWTIGLALGFSILVGVVFGTYPAYRASKMDPVEALRYE